MFKFKAALWAYAFSFAFTLPVYSSDVYFLLEGRTATQTRGTNLNLSNDVQKTVEKNITALSSASKLVVIRTTHETVFSDLAAEVEKLSSDDTIKGFFVLAHGAPYRTFLYNDRSVETGPKALIEEISNWLNIAAPKLAPNALIHFISCRMGNECKGSNFSEAFRRIELDRPPESLETLQVSLHESWASTNDLNPVSKGESKYASGLRGRLAKFFMKLDKKQHQTVAIGASLSALTLFLAPIAGMVEWFHQDWISGFYWMTTSASAYLAFRTMSDADFYNRKRVKKFTLHKDGSVEEVQTSAHEALKGFIEATTNPPTCSETLR